MSYLHIDNLYKDQDILLFKECYALEKIHGTSAHLSWKEGKLNIFSGGSKHESFKALFPESLTTILTEKFGNVQHVVIYGEAYGGKLQGMSNTYGKELKFVVFDVTIDGIWLAVPNTHELVQSLGLEFVHYNKISTDLAAIDKERDADSVQAIRNGVGPGKIREGVVLRPLIELTKNNGSRIIVKHKRDEFRETQEKRSVETDPDKLKVLSDAKAIAMEYVTVMRLEHILDKMDQSIPFDETRTGEVITVMLADVLRESAGEIVDTREARSAIGKQTAGLYMGFLKSRLQKRESTSN